MKYSKRKNKELERTINATAEKLKLIKVRESDFWNACPYNYEEIKSTYRHDHELNEWRNLCFLVYLIRIKNYSKVAKIFNRKSHSSIYRAFYLYKGNLLPHQKEPIDILKYYMKYRNIKCNKLIIKNINLKKLK